MLLTVTRLSSLTGKTQTLFDAPRVGTHTSTPEAEFSSANVSVRLGPQDNIVRDREVRTGGDVDSGGGTGFIASQDEPHEEEPAIDQAPAEEEEKQDSGEWAAEEEYEEDEEVPATEAGGAEGSNERVSADRDESFLSYRPQTGRRTTRGASGASDTIQKTATPGRSIKLSWKTPCMLTSTIFVGEIASAPLLS